MTDTTRYECCLCPYAEEVGLPGGTDFERGDRSLVDHLVRAHDLDRNAVLGCECRPLRFADGPDFYQNTHGYFLGLQQVARVTIQGEKLDAKEWFGKVR
jgi:hypothetical protein